jgi:ferric-dicitrate binding protein FerR (iron transport regulator)
MNQSYWKEQLYKYRMRSLTSAEEELLWDALADTSNAEEWKQIMGEMFLEQAPGEEYQINDWEPVLQAVFNSGRTVHPAMAHRFLLIRRLTVAAAVACGFLVGGYWLVTKYTKKERPTIVQTQRPMDIPAPAANRAMITLGNGQRVYLDSADKGALAQQGNAQVVKEANGQVAYKVENITDRQMIFNTLTNPRGSQVVNLTLSDGTKVWLNAESSLRYPVIFTGQDRTVEITGEGYFEVKKKPDQPFIVDVKNGAKIEVLGTSFNVNAYPDEDNIEATLMEGSVRVAAASSSSAGVNTNGDKLSVFLKPCQQARIAGRKPNDDAGVAVRGVSVLNNVDIAVVVAWKNGLFAFNDADLPTVMRQLARWYNIDVTFEGRIPKKKFQFNGKIGKDLTLNNVLDLLTNAQVHFVLEEGNKLVIRP